MPEYSRALRQDIIEWDVDNWGRALEIWDAALPDVQGQRALDIGSRRGGVSLYLALRGCDVICSDRGGPHEAARLLHERYGIADHVRYADVDATRIPYQTDELDVVAFKSVLGGIGGALGFDGQRQAVREMWRVLRPGGTLLFAENMTASPVHGLLRRTLVPWGARWRYIASRELAELLEDFDNVHVQTVGLLATFGRSERQRAALHRIDRILETAVPDRWKYIAIGSATKPRI